MNIEYYECLGTDDRFGSRRFDITLGRRVVTILSQRMVGITISPVGHKIYAVTRLRHDGVTIRQERGHTSYVRDNPISWIDKREIAVGKPVNGNIMQRWCRVQGVTSRASGIGRFT
jgi:hypothetical protein